jgi:hypothetical protein
MAGWQGNVTLKMDEKEDTYSPGSIEVERYGEDAIALKLSGGEGRASVVLRFTKGDCKALIRKLTESL